MKFLDASTADDLVHVALALSKIQHHTRTLGIETVVVGAVARDIILRHHVGLEPERATADIDVAIAVSSWKDYDALTRPLDGPLRSSHKFRVAGIAIDIIPFGGIESPDRTITWPDDHRMNVLGFAEALASAVRVKLPHQIEVSVASLPAQSILKLLAWRDRRWNSRKDAVDMRTLLMAYHAGPYFDALYEEHIDLLELHHFDPMIAGAERIGRDASALISDADRTVIRDTLLCDDDVLGALAADMGSGRVSDNRALLEAYRHGFSIVSDS